VSFAFEPSLRSPYWQYALAGSARQHDRVDTSMRTAQAAMIKLSLLHVNPALPNIRKIVSLLTREQRSAIARLGILIVVGTILETFGIGLVVPALSLLIDPARGTSRPFVESWMTGWSYESVVIVGMLSLVVVYILKNAFLGLIAWKETRLTSGINVEIAQRLFAHYISRPYTFHLQRNSGLLLNALTHEANSFAHHAVGGGIRLVAEIAVLAALSSLLLAMEPVGTLAVGAMASLAAWAYLRVTRPRVNRWAVERQRHDDMSIQHLQQGLGAVKDLLVLGREAEFIEKFQWHNVRSAQAEQRHQFVQQFPRLGLEVCAILALAGLTIMMVVRGQSPLAAVPLIALFAAAAFRLLPSINRILIGVQYLRFSAPAVERIHDELIVSAGSSRRPEGALPPLTTRIELRDVVYTYPESPEPALKHASLTIACGEFVGLAGPSGAGKTTLVDVLLGLLQPDSGTVEVDDVDIGDRVRAWQDQIGYVPQTIYLTDDTLRRNIAFGIRDGDIDDRRVWNAVRAAQLERFVTSLPSGLETRVGELGVRLSGGERQRIGIARALYHEPTVLVLDEATSSLDVHTEREVMETILQMRGTKTIVAISHRHSAIEHCDRIYELSAGRVIERRSISA
jgi:ATP-binding cassette, subfamily B, bacterial PglK